MPLNFHELHELFWIREIKFVKCCRNVIAIGKNAWVRENLNADIQFLKNSWKYTSVKITPYTLAHDEAIKVQSYSYLKLLQLDDWKVAITTATFRPSSCSSFK